MQGDDGVYFAVQHTDIAPRLLALLERAVSALDRIAAALETEAEASLASIGLEDVPEGKPTLSAFACEHSVIGSCKACGS